MIITLRLPFEGKTNLKAGDRVDFDKPLFQEKQNQETKFLLAEKLGVPPNRIFHHLKKFVGDDIKRGEVLAEKKSFLDNKKVLSDIEGILKEINHNEGYVLVDIKSNETKTKNCFFKGEIEGVEKKVIRLKVGSYKEFPIKETINIQDEFVGWPVYYLTEKPKEFIEEDVEGKVIACSKIVSYHQVKLEALGVAGFISLGHLSEITNLPFIQLKNIEDMKTILKIQLPYCIIDRKESKIILYS